VKDEIYEIPFRAELCYQKNKGLILPEDIPYIGMGASNIASKTFRYLGINIFPEKAAEYYNYLTKYERPGNGVLISQSGQSSETLWCADYFESFIAVVNNPDSPLGQHKNCSKKVCLYSGNEDKITAKTYINTLLIMYLGFGFDPLNAIKVLKSQTTKLEQVGIRLGETIRSKLRWKRHASIYVLGNGPNIATANVAALVLSAVTKVPVLSMSVSQYDHGFKETAKNTLVIGINHEGAEYLRTKKLFKTIQNAGAQVFEIDKPMVDSVYSPLTFPLPFYFAAEYLSNKLKVKSLFQVGDKITQTDLKNTKTE
jgi:glucosamine--fructose-6-phosphate aminotransferase (isomerizing)